MIRGPKTTVRALKRAVRAKVAASPVLRRDRRRLGRSWLRDTRVGWVVRFFISIYLVALLSSRMVAGRSQSLPLVFAVLAFWTLVVTVYRASQITQVFADGQALWVPFVLPVENYVAFDSQNRTLYAFSAGLFTDYALLGLMAAKLLGGGLVGWLAILPFAAAQTTVALALGWMPNRWLPPKFVTNLLLGLWLIAAIGFILLRYDDALLQQLIAGSVGTFLACTPGGMLLQSWFQVLTSNATTGWLSLVVVPIAVFLIIQLEQWRRAEFSLEKVFHYGEPEAASLAPVHTDDADDAEEELAPSKPSTEPTPALAARLAVALRQKLDAPPAWKICAGKRVAEALWRRQTPRQRVVYETMQPVPASWVNCWKFVFGALLISCLFMYVPLLDPDKVLFGRLICDGIAVLFSLPVFFERWVGFGQRRVFQSMVPLYSAFPVGAKEIVGLYLKQGLLRTLAASPILFLAIRLAAPLGGASWATVALWTVKAVYVLILLQVPWLLASISSSTNDTRRLALSSAIAIIWCAVACLAFIFMTGAFFALTAPVATLALAAGLALTSLGSLAAYVLWYNTYRFDLVTLPKT